MGSWSEQRAPGKFSVFVSKYRKINQQPTSPRNAKYLQTRGWGACSTSTGLHCPPSVLQVAAFHCSICKHPWAMWVHSSITRKSLWAHTAHPLRCKRKQHPPRLPKGRNIKGTSVRSNPVPTEATTNSSARAGSRTGPMLSFYLFLNLLPSAPKQVRWEFFRIVFWHRSQKQIREHMNFLQLFGEGREGVWRC